jgi:cell wall-associated NlpC family hydrolase
MIDYNDLIGKPFQDQGRGPHGYDCYGLLVEIYRRNGITLPPVNVSVCACQDLPQAEINKHIKNWNKLKEPEIPCAILIKAHLGYAQHIAAYIGNRRMIHVTADRAVVVDPISKYKNKIIGFYQYVYNNHIN